jgi:hypothetical protein
LKWFGFRLKAILATASAASKNDIALKVVKGDSKKIIFLNYSKSMANSV